jgi:hypothetical protein
MPYSTAPRLGIGINYCLLQTFNHYVVGLVKTIVFYNIGPLRGLEVKKIVNIKCLYRFYVTIYRPMMAACPA